jgi:hypothetical protein
MSITKIFMIVIVVAVVAVTGFVLLNRDAAGPIEEPVAAVEEKATTTPPVVYDTATPPEDITDDGLNADLAAIDAQLNNLATDGASVDSGLGDKPIPQE